MKSSVKVYCDFDGTITNIDVIDLLLEKLADPKWHDIEARWIEGEIGSKECLSRQIPLIKGGWDAVDSLIQEVSLEPKFKSFSEFCQQRNIPIFIVSEGLESVIKSILKREKINVSGIWSNKLEYSNDKVFEIKFPYPPPLSKAGYKLGLCKCQVLERIAGNELKIVIGDGLNDVCWIKNADLIFAKSKLLQECRANNLPCIPFNNFESVTSVLESVLDGEYIVVSGKLVKNIKHNVK